MQVSTTLQIRCLPGTRNTLQLLTALALRKALARSIHFRDVDGHEHGNLHRSHVLRWKSYVQILSIHRPTDDVLCQVLSSFARLAWRALVQVNSQQDLLRVHEVRAVHRRIGHETHMFAHALRSLPASCRTNSPFLLQIWRARSDAYESLRRFLEGCKPFVWSERLCYRLKNVVRRVMTK